MVVLHTNSSTSSNSVLDNMPFKRVASRFQRPNESAEISNPRHRSPVPPRPPRSRRQLTSAERDMLTAYWDLESLEWVLDNAHLCLKDLIDMGLGLIPFPHDDDVDWSALEYSSSEEADIPPSGPSDCYGIPLTSCYLCGKIDVSTRIVSCRICFKKAHTSCLQWMVREDPRKPGHFHWYCPAHNRVWFLEG